MDPSKPAQVDAAIMADTIQRYQVTHMFASPAFLHRVGQYGKAKSIWFSSLRHVISGGAPVMPSILACFRKTLSPDTVFHTTYGATEALPISSIADYELMDECHPMTLGGKGTCVGKPLKGNEVRIISLSDRAISVASDELLVHPGEVGEIIVSGEIVSRRYQGHPELNSLLKIQDGNRVWHRTGDLGWMDSQSRIWFCGRKSQSVISSQGVFHTAQWEGVFNAHPAVYRSALVGVGLIGAQVPVVCLELRKKELPEDQIRIETELRKMAVQNPITQSASVFLFHPSFPVDIRHNAKINREVLAQWARSRLEPDSTFFGVPRSRQMWMMVPVVGWMFIFYGLFFPIENGILKAFWWIDLVLSLGAHGLQLGLALPEGKKAGFTTRSIVLLTFLFGATWWKSLFTQKGHST
jgi:acyl-coenzyme A synthetase/AMP-(fatty) acid ligase